MPKAFDKWQVFPHRPLEKLEPNLWRIEGDLPGANGTRVMTIARLKDGSLCIHNGIALEDELMTEIEAFGKPTLLVVPNGFHRLDSKIYKERYPSLRVICPTGARAKVEQVVKVDATYGEGVGDETVRFFHLDGTKEREGIVEVESEGKKTVIFNDVLNNLPKMSGFFGFLLAPTGKPSVPRIAKWITVSSRPALKAHLEKLATTPNLSRIIVSHGAVMTAQPGEILRTVASAL
jgi:hypothetical protein